MDLDDSQKQENGQSFPSGNWFQGKCKFLFLGKCCTAAAFLANCTEMKRLEKLKCESSNSCVIDDQYPLNKEDRHPSSLGTMYCLAQAALVMNRGFRPKRNLIFATLMHFGRYWHTRCFTWSAIARASLCPE
jgi:hypothetical protein